MFGPAWLFWPALALVTLGLLAMAPQPAHGAVTKCTMIVPDGPREVMINTCDACRTIEILRKRPGNDVPVQRTFTLLPGSRMQVPFLGPGRSRITSEQACPGEPGAAENLIEPPKRAKHQPPEACVALERAGAGVALVNRCGACRAALIERVDGIDGGNQRQAYKLAARTALAVPADGYARVGLIGDIACP
jgi:hypothetical protein